MASRRNSQQTNERLAGSVAECSGGDRIQVPALAKDVSGCSREANRRKQSAGRIGYCSCARRAASEGPQCPGEPQTSEARGLVTLIPGVGGRGFGSRRLMDAVSAIHQCLLSQAKSLEGWSDCV